MLEFLAAIPVIGRVIAWVYRLFAPSPVEKAVKRAYEEVREARRAEAEAKEESIRLTQEKASVELAKKDFDDFFREEDY